MQVHTSQKKKKKKKTFLDPTVVLRLVQKGANTHVGVRPDKKPHGL